MPASPKSFYDQIILHPFTLGVAPVSSEFIKCDRQFQATFVQHQLPHTAKPTVEEGQEPKEPRLPNINVNLYSSYCLVAPVK